MKQNPPRIEQDHYKLSFILGSTVYHEVQRVGEERGFAIDASELLLFSTHVLVLVWNRGAPLHVT